MKHIQLFEDFINESYYGIVGVDFTTPVYISGFKGSSHLNLTIDNQLCYFDSRSFSSRVLDENKKVADKLKKYFGFDLNNSGILVNGYFEVFDIHPGAHTIKCEKDGHILSLAIDAYILKKGKTEIHNDRAD